MASELQQLLDEAAGLMGWKFVGKKSAPESFWCRHRDTGIGKGETYDSTDCHPIPPTLDSILAAFEEAFGQTPSVEDGWWCVGGVKSVRMTGHTLAAWRLDLARLLVAALRAEGGKS